MAGIGDWWTLSGPEFFAQVFRLLQYPHTLIHRRMLVESEAADALAQEAALLAALQAEGLVERR